MPLKTQMKTLGEAKESDAACIADIHIAAFETNVQFIAQFPTPPVRKGLWTSLRDKAISEIRDPKWVVLVVRNEEDQVIGFAKWCRPILKSENYEEPPWQWPEGTNMAALNEWTAKVEAANAKILHNTPCYRLSFCATDPRYQRQGVASLLVGWGMRRSKEENIPVALESTPEGTIFYEKLGFKAEGRISMQLDGVGQDGASVLYEETCFVFWPDFVG
ncbi:GNAT family acetyltransferase, putative [Coccidioides posadasii C735 delta SOWgp]|uniref:GNAT family acetyltransferase, putative n=1 Tax=Coccidioides posadasii (strain C735) TaxID=222929 RepID=C5PIX0_COCP7|nr:GNAT family acetyltransferase, putative [Coccidioides posadasii C735 delta SOWgp]EER24473.1 GNAT family acetyltransferase, putative [Coccidioides posadasii C735 delta SOWgp]|eukprot:XP_003066618.1 GNAT family acetyltransferase, putative [Coccidioides posadasii C735 delta SOWgp]